MTLYPRLPSDCSQWLHTDAKQPWKQTLEIKSALWYPATMLPDCRHIVSQCYALRHVMQVCICHMLKGHLFILAFDSWDTYFQYPPYLLTVICFKLIFKRRRGQTEYVLIYMWLLENWKLNNNNNNIFLNCWNAPWKLIGEGHIRN